MMRVQQNNTGLRRKKNKFNTKKSSNSKKENWKSPHLPHFNLPTDITKARFQIVALIFIGIWIILWCRAFYLQIVIGPELRQMASKQHQITQLVEAKRGNIYDRNGQILARSVEAKSVYAHPKQITDKAFAAKTIAPILGLNKKRLQEHFEEDRSFIWLKRKVDDATALAIQKTNIPGIGLSTEYERVYPYKHLAGQLLGFVGVDNKGLEGIERAFNDKLVGDSQKQIVPRDIAGRALYDINDKDSRGEDLHLTIDVQLQFIAEEVIAKAVETNEAKWGGVLIVDAKKSNILAWAQYPFFNPNNFRNYSPTIYRNRLAADAVEPGSTFKPLIIAGALQKKVIDLTTKFYTEKGVWTIDHIKIGKSKKPFTIGDDGRAYEDLTPEEILAYSSNIGMAKITQAMGAKTTRNFLLDLGFGKDTGVGVAESKGIIRPLKDWSEADLLSTGFGQSLSVTALQMVQAFNILANDGERVQLHILQDDENNVAEQNVIDRKVARNVLKMMETVVDGNGTGKNARIPGVRVAGKTGTAQKAHENNTAGYSDKRMASFIGIVPADSPKYVIYIILDNLEKNSYGGKLAAPVFQEIAQRSMAYSGDLPDVIFASESDNLTGKTIKKQFDKKTQIKRGVVPNVTKLSLKKAIEIFQEFGQLPEIIGEGLYVVKQEPPAGTKIIIEDDKKKETVINHTYKLYLSEQSILAEQQKQENTPTPNNTKNVNVEQKQQINNDQQPNKTGEKK